MRLIVCLALLATACGGSEPQEPAAPSVDESAAKRAPNPYGFAVWFDDFPGAPEHPHLSPRNPGAWYSRSPRQAVESLVAKLQGNCSRDGWLFAKDVFSRIERDRLPLLVEELDRNMQVPERSDHVENLVEAIGRAADPTLAPALLRALDHPSEAVRSKVMHSLVTSGSPESVFRAWTLFPHVEAKGQNGWIRAAAAHLGADAVEPFRTILRDPRFANVGPTVIAQALAMPPERALEVFAAFGDRVPADLQPTVAGLRHAAGDGGGTALLVRFLEHEAPQVRASAIAALRFGRKAELVDRVLSRTVDPDPDVRLAALNMLADAEGDVVTDAIEGMLADEALSVRQGALRVLVERGRRAPLDDLLQTVRTATGSRLHLAIADLVAARDPRAAKVFADRMRATPRDEWKGYLRSLALLTTPESFEPLREVFLSDDDELRGLADYVAYMMANLRGAELRIVDLFLGLERSDYRRRALCVMTLANIAADRESAEIKGAVYSAFRAVVEDATDLPQMRLLALEYLRRDLTLADWAKVRGLLELSDEPMRRALSDFLFEFF